MDMTRIIAEPVKMLSEWIVESRPANIEDIFQKWHDLTGMDIRIDNDRPASSITLSSTLKKVPKVKETCRHIFESGQKAGQQCLTKPKNGADLCSSHKPKDDSKTTPSGSKRSTKKKVDIDPNYTSDGENDKPIAEKEEEAVTPKKASSKKQKKTTDKKPAEDSYDTENEPLDENILLEDD